jgi:hypothetical protein
VYIGLDGGDGPEVGLVPARAKLSVNTTGSPDPGRLMVWYLIWRVTLVSVPTLSSTSIRARVWPLMSTLGSSSQAETEIAPLAGVKEVIWSFTGAAWKRLAATVWAYTASVWAPTRASLPLKTTVGTLVALCQAKRSSTLGLLSAPELW